MKSELKKSLQNALKKVLFDDQTPYNLNSPKLSEKVSLIVSLCNYYNVEEGSPELAELKRLNECLVNFELLKVLADNLTRLASKDFHWNPDFHRFHSEMPQNITLSPTFQMGNIDFSSLISEIEKIRSDIESRKINLISLISYISRKAKESNDFDINNEND